MTNRQADYASGRMYSLPLDTMNTILAVLIMTAMAPAQDTRASEHGNPPRMHLLRVTGHPFQAEFEETVSIGRANSSKMASRSTGKLYRDRYGSIRVERTIGGDPGQSVAIAEIQNVRSRSAVVLDLTHKLLMMDEQIPGEPAEAGESAWMFYEGLPTYTDEYRLIEGVRCRRIKMKTSPGGQPPDAGEVWWSEELRMVIVDTHQERGREVIWQVRRLQRVDPDPSLFEIPQDFLRVR
jgi:hypothetical protein